MAIAPLFVASMADVKARLRMSGVPAGVDANDLIEESVRTVRAGFYRQLEASRITTILGTTEVDNPTSTADVLRQIASVTEIKWLRYELMQTIPTMFFDSAPAAQQAWNEEGMVRGMTSTERESQLKRLWDDINDALIVLAGEEEMPDESSLKIFVLEPEAGPRRIGGSLWAQ